MHTLPRFHFFDLLVCIGVALLMLVVVVGARQQVQQQGDIVACADNLRRIFDAIGQYQLTHNAFPRTRFVEGAPIASYTAPEAGNPFAETGPQPNDVTAAAFLLARGGLPATVFNCPAALRNGLAERDAFTDATVQNRSNFRARVNYNYSLLNMYPNAASEAVGYDPKSRANPQFVIASDTSSGPEEGSQATTKPASLRNQRMANSPNHQREGQNLLFADGRVGFAPTPMAGVDFDNASTSAGTFPNPASATDTVLLPTWSMGPDVTPKALTLRRWAFMIALIGSTVVIAWVVWHGRRKASQASAS
jgi:hypothetical protein